MRSTLAAGLNRWTRRVAAVALLCHMQAWATRDARLDAQGARNATGLTATAVVRLAQDRDTGRDSRADMRMRLFDRQ